MMNTCVLVTSPGCLVVFGVLVTVGAAFQKPLLPCATLIVLLC